MAGSRLHRACRCRRGGCSLPRRTRPGHPPSPGARPPHTEAATGTHTWRNVNSSTATYLTWIAPTATACRPLSAAPLACPSRAPTPRPPGTSRARPARPPRPPETSGSGHALASPAQPDPRPAPTGQHSARPVRRHSTGGRPPGRRVAQLPRPAALGLQLGCHVAGRRGPCQIDIRGGLARRPASGPRCLARSAR
jgi:hypothetical protein